MKTLLLFISLVVTSFCSAQEISASSLANDQLSQSGVVVKFSYSTPKPADYNPVVFGWDFKDGLRGTGNPYSHRFTHAGTFDVLLVTDDGHGNQRNYHRLVKINSPVEFPEQTLPN